MADDQSVFAPKEQTPSQTSDVTPAIADLVGEGKKYATEQDALASIPSAQTHIANIEQENAELRSQMEELKTSSTSMDTVLEAISQRNQPAETPQTSGPVDEGTLLNMVEQVVDNRSKASIEQANINEADKIAQRAFGDEAKAKVAEAAASMGVSLDFLLETAKRSPNAFAKMVGANSPTQEAVKAPTGATTTSSVNSDSFNSGNDVRDFTYYNKMRKEDPTRYKSLTTQQEMMRSRSELGNRFFKS